MPSLSLESQNWASPPKGSKKNPNQKESLGKMGSKNPLVWKKIHEPSKGKTKNPLSKEGHREIFFEGGPTCCRPKKPPLKKWGFFGPSSKKNPPKKAREKGLKRKGYHQKNHPLQSRKRPKKVPFRIFLKKAQKNHGAQKIQAQKNGVPSKKEWDRSQKNTSKKLLANSPPSTMKF